MPDAIRDGTGSGNLAKVTSHHQLYTFSITRPEIADVSLDDSRAFLLCSPVFTPGVGVGETTLWFKHSDASHNLMVVEVVPSWNGGNTNHNRSLLVQWLSGTSEPSANRTAVTPVNLNLGSTVSSDITAWAWDNVGTGLTVATPGTVVGSNYLTQGRTACELGGALIIPADIPMAFRFTAEEAGSGTLALLCFFVDKD